MLIIMLIYIKNNFFLIFNLFILLKTLKINNVCDILLYIVI